MENCPSNSTIETITAVLESSWQSLLADCLIQPQALQLGTFLQQQQLQHTVYPPRHLIYTALQCTPVDTVKVVMLGQDPYHGPGQAMGLAFSVANGIQIPPSLRNIHTEMYADISIQNAGKGDLTAWAQQGVLLLNSVLTVRAGAAASHAGQGWEWITDQIIARLQQHHHNIVYILWGKYAQRKAAGIDPTHNHIIASAHPSPFSAHNGFFGSRPFSATNTYLQNHAIQPIDWQL